MKEPYCEKEQEVAAALANGSCDVETLGHARDCATCAEILRVAQFLREGTQLAVHEVDSLPDATIIWRKAQALARQKALVRAALPIRAARIVTSVVGAVVAPLVILKSVRFWPRLPDLWTGHGSSPITPWPAGMDVSLLMLTIMASIVLIGLSSWLMLRDA